MAHFAELDSYNRVLRVVVVGNDDCLDADGNESESVGVAFCKNLFGEHTIWKQTSYNRNFRKNYAVINGVYDPTLDGFIPPCPYPSWLFVPEECSWTAPTPRPEDDKLYFWDEVNKQWVEVTE